MPLLDIIYRMDTGVEISHDDKDLNPEQEVRRKEPVDGLLHPLSAVIIAGSLDKVFRPEATSIFQRISDVLLPATIEILYILEISVIIQVADVPLQPLFHNIQA